MPASGNKSTWDPEDYLDVLWQHSTKTIPDWPEDRSSSRFLDLRGKANYTLYPQEDKSGDDVVMENAQPLEVYQDDELLEICGDYQPEEEEGDGPDGPQINADIGMEDCMTTSQFDAQPDSPACLAPPSGSGQVVTYSCQCQLSPHPPITTINDPPCSTTLEASGSTGLHVKDLATDINQLHLELHMHDGILQDLMKLPGTFNVLSTNATNIATHINDLATIVRKHKESVDEHLNSHDDRLQHLDKGLESLSTSLHTDITAMSSMMSAHVDELRNTVRAPTLTPPSTLIPMGLFGPLTWTVQWGAGVRGGNGSAGGSSGPGGAGGAS
ncbi:hypothetical protein EWM64_g8989 [Hericium alpestre]|uniref:Uncharacterized protein n=1 Tax=Hericium alpestre TaxID=135208 RepID=A0A4Y9ZM31_9AGAM|nr:hypothetical protein EWM64_g8989 [Hericium alpestre]